MNLLEKALGWHAEKLIDVSGVPVVYERGASRSPLLASVGRTVFRVENAYGVAERVESRDYIVRVKDLVGPDGAQLVPQRGDRIRETQGTIAYVYEVMAPGDEPPYRFSDAFRNLYRIHTKLVATENL